MIGGPPVFFAPPPVSMLPPGYGPVPYTPSPVRAAQAPSPRAPVVRGQMAEQSAPPVPLPAVAMPSPDQLGVNAKPADGICDWSAARRRMQDLGIISYQLGRPDANVFEFTCLMPAEAGRTHRIEAHGATETEAVRCGLDEAQRWKSRP